MSISNVLDNYVEKALGTLTLPVELSESDIDKLKSAATYRYFTACPITKNWSVSVQRGETLLDVGQVSRQLFPNTYERYEFLGAARADYLLTGESFSGNVDAFLSGSQGINYYPSRYIGGVHSPLSEQNTGLPFYEPTTDLAAVTARDQLLAEIDTTYDPVEKNMHIVAQAEGSTTLKMCYAYVGDISVDPPVYPWDGVRPDHVELLANLMTEYFLEALIISRSSVILEGDAQIDISFIQSRYETLVESNREDIARFAMPVVALG